MLFDEKRASWKHIEELCAINDRLCLKLTPKLTQQFELAAFKTMKVKLAAQVLNNSVLVALETYVALNKISSAAINTAIFVEDIYRFDNFNSTQLHIKQFGKLRYAIYENSCNLFDGS